MGRREVLGVVGLAALAGTKAAIAQTIDTSTMLRAVVTIGTSTYEYRQENGKDLGDFVSTIGNFTQSCIRCDTAGFPLTVFFRPDRNATRAEVVFELGRLWSGTPANLGAYTAAIYRGTTLLATVSVPAHYWFTRWRWQSAPRPVVADVATLISQKLLPPYDRSAVAPSAPAAAPPPALPAHPLQVPDGNWIDLDVLKGIEGGDFSHASSLVITALMTSTSLTSGSTTTTTTTPSVSPDGTSITAGGGGSLKTTDGTWTFSTTKVNNDYVILLNGQPAGNGSSTSMTVAGGGKLYVKNSINNVYVWTGSGWSQTSMPATTTTTTSTTTTTGTAAVYTVMGLAGVTAYMPQTGERPDIGLLTEPQANYVCTAAQVSLDTLRAQGEAGGSMPWHMRDENTNAPLDFSANPKATFYPDPVYGTTQIKGTANPVTLDSAHMPNLVYLPYLLTGDPYHLEDLQFQANWNWGWYNPSYRPSIPQARQFAWNLRTLAGVTKVTPAATPSWLMPQAYFASQLSTWRTFFETYYVNATREERSIFRCCTPIDSSSDQGSTAPGGCWVSMWEDEFCAAVLGWVVSMGFTEWRTSFDWKIGSTIARTNGTSGWPRGQATPYRAILRQTATSPFVQSWPAGWTLTQSVTGAQLGADPNVWFPSDMTYLTYTRGALVYANTLGTPTASTSLAWATQQLVSKAWHADYKWRLGTGLS